MLNIKLKPLLTGAISTSYLFLLGLLPFFVFELELTNKKGPQSTTTTAQID